MGNGSRRRGVAVGICVFAGVFSAACSTGSGPNTALTSTSSRDVVTTLRAGVVTSAIPPTLATPENTTPPATSTTIVVGPAVIARPSAGCANGGGTPGETMVVESTATSTGSTDVGFITSVLDRVEASRCIDQARVDVDGMSNRAFMTSVVACQLSDRIAAAARSLESEIPTDAPSIERFL
jgi:hypothetical protein